MTPSGSLRDVFAHRLGRDANQTPDPADWQLPGLDQTHDGVDRDTAQLASNFFKR
jgi:hypothetical protein